jgi:hypothetical protein
MREDAAGHAAGPWRFTSRKDDTMTDQNKNAQRSSSEAEQRNAGGIDDIDIDVDDMDEGVENDEPRQAGGGRQSESEKPDSPDSRWGSKREE